MQLMNRHMQAWCHPDTNVSHCWLARTAVLFTLQSISFLELVSIGYLWMSSSELITLDVHFCQISLQSLKLYTNLHPEFLI